MKLRMAGMGTAALVLPKYLKNIIVSERPSRIDQGKPLSSPFFKKLRE